ncbi:MAG: PIN domain-containing protein [Pseudomonadota bacterium]|nr:PIN domain-containing protein [Pseudomonadota bacterium]
MRVFLDANILFSASRNDSNLHRLVHILSKEGIVMTSVYVREETWRNLKRKRPTWEATFHNIMKIVALVPDYPLQEKVSLHVKDHPVLGAAIAARCDYLLTGDKRDFNHLYGKIIGGVTIIDYLTLARML